MFSNYMNQRNNPRGWPPLVIANGNRALQRFAHQEAPPTYAQATMEPIPYETAPPVYGNALMNHAHGQAPMPWAHAPPAQEGYAYQGRHATIARRYSPRARAPIRVLAPVVPIQAPTTTAPINNFPLRAETDPDVFTNMGHLPSNKHAHPLKFPMHAGIHMQMWLKELNEGIMISYITGELKETRV